MSCEILILNLPHEESQGKIMTCPHWGSIITYGACISVCEKAQQWQQHGIAILIPVFWKREWQMLVNAGESRQHNRIILPQWVFWLHAHAWFAVSSTRKVDDCLSLHNSLTGGTGMNWECRKFSNKACYVLVERAAPTKVATERHCIQCSHHSVTWRHYKKASKLKDETASGCRLLIFSVWYQQIWTHNSQTQVLCCHSFGSRIANLWGPL